MTHESVENDRLSCAEVAPFLEKYIIKESLTPGEQETLHRHLGHCQGCKDFTTWSGGLSQFAPQISEAAQLSAFDSAADNYFEVRRSRRRLAVSIVAGVAAAAAIGIFVALSPGPDETGMSPQFARCVSTEPEVVTKGVFMTHCADNTPKTAVDSNGDLRVTLESGAVGLSVDPNRPRKNIVSVLTRFGKVTVLGTVFTVHIEGKDARVEVFRGTVEVRTDEEETPLWVNEKSGAWLNEGQRYILPEPTDNPLYPPLMAISYDEETSGRRPASGTKTDEAMQDGGVVSPAEDDSSISSRGVGAQRGRIPSLDNLLAEARNCLIDKEWRCAADRYQKILRKYDKRWESMSALISLAKIELRHLGKPNQALRHFAAYKKRYPKGPLLEEAIFGMAECHRRLDNPTKELEILRSFIENHPKNSLTAKAKRRIRELETR